MAPNDNQILHAALLRGTLSIKVTDVDIRKTGNDALGISPIETDYILRVQSSKHEGSANDLDTFYCSKRYLDVRNLAYALHSYAVEVVNYHANKSGSAGGSLTNVPGKLLKILEKPIEILQYTTNTEPNSSDLAGELDDVLRNSDEGHVARRTSKLLDKCAPLNVRDVLEAVDEFYEAILSEKRQFGLKSNFAHVEKVAHRRKALMDDAFSNFLLAFNRAGICNEVLPPVLDELVYGFEYFLLTDVIVDQGREKRDELRTTAPQAQDDISTSIRPRSVRRRASREDREREHDSLRCSTNGLAIPDEQLADRNMDGNGIVTGKKMNYTAKTHNLLPEDGMGFAALAAIGASCFKVLGGRSITLQLDIMVLLLLSCILLGYQMSLKSSFNDSSMPQPPTSHDTQVTGEQRRPTHSRDRPSLADFGKTSGAHNLIRTSFRRLSAVIFTPKQPPKVALKTFEKFPLGAALGSHLNCWSIPVSSCFHVRGPDYLDDKKKVPSADFLLPCRGCDLFLTDNPPLNIGRNSSILAGELRDKPTFIINYRLPWGVFITYHEIPEKFLPFLRRSHGYGDTSEPLPSQSDMNAGERCLCNFFLSDSDEKNEVWKIVPVVVEGPWVVKRVVGGKPAIVGKSLPITYTYQPPQPELGFAEYLEADLDIVSSAAARNILAVVRSSVQVLTLDLGFVVQGNTKEDLPEQMMAGLRLHGLDPLSAEALPDCGDEDMLELESAYSD